MIYKILQKNLKIEQYEPLKEHGVKSCAPEGLTIRHYEIIGESKYIELLIVVYCLKTDWLIEEKISRHVSLGIQVLAGDRHKHVAGKTH